MTRPHILLVHGANHGAWCWLPVIPHLEERGFAVHTVDLPGRRDTIRWGWMYRLAPYVGAVLDAISAIGAPVVAVGHSMGGMVIAAAAERDPRAFRRLVFLTAFLPRDGDSLAALGAEDTDSRLTEGIRSSLICGRVEIVDGPGADIFYGDCDDAQRRWAYERLIKEPLGPSVDKVRLSAGRFGVVARSYIRCTQDQALSIGFQDEMIARQSCDKVATLHASHSPFLSMPQALAAAIAQVV